MLRRLLLLVSSSLLALALTTPMTSAAADSPGPSDVLLTLLVPHAEVGQPTPATLTATRDGEPVPGLVAEVTRTGPGAKEPATTTAVTDEAGVATFEVLVMDEGEFSVVATVTDATGAAVGTAGPVVAQGYWLDSCGGGYPERAAAASRRCSPPHPDLDGKDGRSGHDRVAVRWTFGDAPGRVRLFRVHGTKNVRIRAAALPVDAWRSFRITDHNGRRLTRYYAVIELEGGIRARTHTIRVR
jgi:hypothetical protein